MSHLGKCAFGQFHHHVHITDGPYINKHGQDCVLSYKRSCNVPTVVSSLILTSVSRAVGTISTCHHTKQIVQSLHVVSHWQTWCSTMVLLMLCVVNKLYNWNNLTIFEVHSTCQITTKYMLRFKKAVTSSQIVCIVFSVLVKTWFDEGKKRILQFWNTII